jgi:hypothetical protein
MKTEEFVMITKRCVTAKDCDTGYFFCLVYENTFQEQRIEPVMPVYVTPNYNTGEMAEADAEKWCKFRN